MVKYLLNKVQNYAKFCSCVGYIDEKKPRWRGRWNLMSDRQRGWVGRHRGSGLLLLIHAPRPRAHIGILRGLGLVAQEKDVFRLLS